MAAGTVTSGWPGNDARPTTSAVPFERMPLENSVEGAVPATLDELANGAPLIIAEEAYLTVTFELVDRKSGRQLLGLLRRIDHLGEQEGVTLHRRAWLPPAQRVSAADAGIAVTPSPPGGRTDR